MNLIEQWGNELFERIDGLPLGFEGGIAEIYGEDWPRTGTIGQRRDFGRQFKASVQSGQISCLEWIGIANSGRHDLYRKIGELKK